jgi:hypothetical protein
MNFLVIIICLLRFRFRLSKTLFIDILTFHSLNETFSLLNDSFRKLRLDYVSYSTGPLSRLHTVNFKSNLIVFLVKLVNFNRPH